LKSELGNISINCNIDEEYRASNSKLIEKQIVIDILTDWERIRWIDEDNKTIMTNTFFRFHMNTGLTILVKSDFEGYLPSS